MLAQCVSESCGRKIEWRPKRDKALRYLACPHCGAGLRQIAGGCDWSDPQAQHQRARHEIARLQHHINQLENALKALKAAPDAIAAAQDAIDRYRQDNLKLVPGPAPEQEARA
jgi:hypothetical protein